MSAPTWTREQLSRQISIYAKLCYDRYLVRAAGGNVSGRLPNNEGFLITPTGVSLRDVEDNAVVAVDGEGRVIDGGKYKPSKETSLHLAVYRLRPDVHAVIHVHPPYSTAFSMKPQGLPLVTSQAKLKLVQVPVVEYAPPGSSELVKKVEEVLLSSDTGVKAVLLEQHGLLAFDADFGLAFDTADLVEETAHIASILR